MNFTGAVSREGTFAYKWEKYRGTDIVPAWIADTEFRCAEPILEAINQRVANGVLGYTLPEQYTPANEAVVHWCKQQYDWAIEPDWIVWTPGVVPAFNMACKAFCQAGDAVIVQTPNYPPLLAAPKLNGLQTIFVETIEQQGRWVLDFEALERAAARPECKLFVLCNPMNPAGSVFSRAELTKIAEICNRHGVRVCSDEIHCDLILDEQQHIPAASLDSLADSGISLMAASKTFNVAGLGTSFAIIPNPRVRAAFNDAGAGIVPWPNILGLVAAEVAFTQCDAWRSQLLANLRENRDMLVNGINKVDGLSALSPAATFLLWVDGSGLNCRDTQQWCESKGVGPSPGRDFGKPEFFRLNFGCSQQQLQQIISRLSQ